MFLGWIYLNGMLITVVISEWLMCFGMGFSRYLNFICIMKGRAGRREVWLQGKSKKKKMKRAAS